MNHYKKGVSSQKNEQLNWRHTWKKPNSKDNNKLGLVALWLEVQEKRAYKPEEWSIDEDSELLALCTENNNREDTTLAREAT